VQPHTALALRSLAATLGAAMPSAAPSAFAPLLDEEEEQERAPAAVPPPTAAASVKPCAFVVSVLLCAATFVPLLPLPDGAPRRGAALFVLAASLWASEAVPAWVTGVLVPVCATALRLPQALSPKERGAFNLASLADPVIYLLLASFALGASMHKHGLDTRLAATTLEKAHAVGPRTLIGVVLCVTCALSAVVGNACAAVAVLLLVTPLVRACPRESRFPQCCVAAAALGANVGGMITPVSSAQNAVALGDGVLGGHGCTVHFMKWVACTLPLCLFYLVAAWVLLLHYWQPTLTELPALPQRAGAPLTGPARAVAAISIATVAAWACFPSLEPIFGDIGVMSLLPIAALWGGGLMAKADFQGLDWTVVVLLGGGCSLGRALQASGLLEHFALTLRGMLASWSPAAASAIYSFTVLVASNFVSHTVGALTLLPLVAAAAQRVALAATIMSAVMCDTCACMLPVSSLPNMVAYASTDDDGVQYLAIADFLKVGLAFETIVFGITNTAGFALSAWVLRDACPPRSDA
jgi:phosphate transporter